jgi:hypothetical protein
MAIPENRMVLDAIVGTAHDPSGGVDALHPSRCFTWQSVLFQRLRPQAPDPALVLTHRRRHQGQNTTRCQAPEMRREKHFHPFANQFLLGSGQVVDARP